MNLEIFNELRRSIAGVSMPLQAHQIVEQLVLTCMQAVSAEVEGLQSKIKVLEKSRQSDDS